MYSEVAKFSCQQTPNCTGHLEDTSLGMFANSLFLIGRLHIYIVDFHEIISSS